MNENDLSAWFVAKPGLKKHGKTFAENFLEPAAIEAVYIECGDILEISQPQKITDIVGAATQTAESVWRDLAAESPAFDCNKGCARCCHQTVMVIVPEALFVKNHIVNTFDLPEIEALKATLRQRLL